MGITLYKWSSFLCRRWRENTRGITAESLRRAPTCFPIIGMFSEADLWRAEFR